MKLREERDLLVIITESMLGGGCVGFGGNSWGCSFLGGVRGLWLHKKLGASGGCEQLTERLDAAQSLWMGLSSCRWFYSCVDD